MQPLIQSVSEAPADTGVLDTLQLAAAASSCGVGTWALDRNEQLRTDDVFLSIWGRTREAFVDAAVSWPVSFVYAEDRARAEAIFGLRADSSVANEVLFRVVLPDGRFRWVLCRRRTLEHSTRERAAGVVLDVTSVRRQDDGRLREAVSALASRLAHDFNNLLFAILGNATLALGTIQPSPDHPLRESLREIERAAMRASEIVQRVSAFARPMQPRRQLHQLSALLNAAVHATEGWMSTNVRIRACPANSTEPLVSVDATLVTDLTRNLLSNASHASEGRPSVVQVGIDDIELNEQPWFSELGIRRGRYLALCVRDEGAGMDPATLERAPEPFFTTRARTGGMGLGLAIAQRIMKAHDGALRLESEPDRGTRVYAYFPVP